MRISLSWLKDFIDLPWSPEVTAEKLAQLGFPVEKITRTGVESSHVVAVKILSLAKHPNADRLQLAQVTDGKKEHSIVCGATNIAPGQVVPLALPGAKLPGGTGSSGAGSGGARSGGARSGVIEITVSKIRGVLSEGMLCSERELGLSEEHAGIYQLPVNSRLGAPVKDLLGGSDVLLDIEITPNRPDLMSHVGLARELSALSQKPLKLSRSIWKKTSNRPALKISIKEPKLCPRYMGKHFRGVKLGPSPDWMARRLNACGIRAINNIVDITNYVLLEWGHPLHAFDFSRLAGPEIKVRRAETGETLGALDGRTYSLTTSDLVIADSERPVALAGIMGGQDSGVTDSTTELLLESAVFDRSAVRQSSRRLALRSESSIRFEKGTEAETAFLASLRAAQLIQEIAGGQLVSALDVYPIKDKPRLLGVRQKRLEAVIGTSLKSKDVGGILKRLDLNPAHKGLSWICRLPSYRRDLMEEADLIEEILRMIGYENVPSARLKGGLGGKQPPYAATDETPAAEFLKGLGLTQTLTSSFCSDGWVRKVSLNPENLIPLMNPISKEETLLRPNLIINLLKAALENIHHQQDRVRLFEIGNTFRKGDQGPVEEKVLGFVLYGPRMPLSWQARQKPLDVFELKGLLESLHVWAGGGWLIQEGSAHPALHPHQSFEIQYRGSLAGSAGLIHPRLQQELNLPGPCALGEIPFRLLTGGKKEVSYPLPRFPFVERDISILVENSVSWSVVQGQVRQSGGPLVSAITPFDVFTGGSLGVGQKSLAFRLRLQSLDHTLTEPEINSAVDAIRSSLQKNCGATLR